jgi:RiboL-PSP-HEPN
MSSSKKIFDSSIQEAESILEFYNELNKDKQRSKELEVLKRAGLIIALTTWETYVEERIEESVKKLFIGASGSIAQKFMLSKLEDELKRFHTPNSDKTKKLFADYLNIDIQKNWFWNNFELPKVVEELGLNKPDLIKIDDLRKSIVFLKNIS